MTEGDISTSLGWNGASWGDNKEGLRPRVCPSLSLHRQVRAEGRPSFPLQRYLQDFLDLGTRILSCFLMAVSRRSFSTFCFPRCHLSPPGIESCTCPNPRHLPTARRTHLPTHCAPSRHAAGSEHGPESHALCQLCDTAHCFLLDSTTLCGFEDLSSSTRPCSHPSRMAQTPSFLLSSPPQPTHCPFILVTPNCP